MRMLQFNFGQEDELCAAPIKVPLDLGELLLVFVRMRAAARLDFDIPLPAVVPGESEIGCISPRSFSASVRNADGLLLIGSDAPSKLGEVKTPHLQQAFASNHSVHLARGELPPKPSARRPHGVASAVVGRVYRKWISPRESRGRGDVVGHCRPCQLALFRGDHRPGGSPIGMSARPVPVFGRNNSHPKVVIPRGKPLRTDDR